MSKRAFWSVLVVLLTASAWFGHCCGKQEKEVIYMMMQQAQKGGQR